MATAPVSHHEAAPSVCPNCGAPLTGQFCSSCGQERLHGPGLTLGHIVHELAHELTHVDGRAWRSVRTLLTQPGRLTAEYVAGRRASYVGPLRLYLIATALFFLSLPFSAMSASSMLQTTTLGPLIRQIEPRAANIGKTYTAGAVDTKFQKIYTFALAGSVIATACVLALFSWKRAFGEHLVFAVHNLANLFLLSSVAGPLSKLPVLSSVLPPMLWLWTVVYLILAYRRFYAFRWTGTLMRATVLILYLEVQDSAVILASVIAAVRGVS